MNLAVEHRGGWEGAAQIVRYNWPRYAAGIAALLVGLTAALALDLPRWMTAVVWSGVALSAWWTVGSVLVSHWVYDRSPLYRWEWARDPAIGAVRRWANVHAGLDESTPGLGRVLGGRPVEVLDVFDASEMTEHSIARARGERAQSARPVGLGDWPGGLSGLDAVFMVFCAHEVRGAAERAALLGRARSALGAGGVVVVVEHLRDAANFAAFGPGFLHFLSRAVWLRTFAAAGLRAARESRITPFVRVFILRSTS
ncbi:MAG: hypothetical protein WD749_05175 [Phycisphaerales bacterium]